MQKCWCRLSCILCGISTTGDLPRVRGHLFFCPGKSHKPLCVNSDLCQVQIHPCRRIRPQMAVWIWCAPVPLIPLLPKPNPPIFAPVITPPWPILVPPHPPPASKPDLLDLVGVPMTVYFCNHFHGYIFFPDPQELPASWGWNSCLGG